MKKIMLSLAMALVSVCASAQVYIGGTAGISSNKMGDADSKTAYKFIPEIGYQFNNKWEAGIEVGIQKGDVCKIAQVGDATTFTVAPYVRYTAVDTKLVNLFLEGTAHPGTRLPGGAHQGRSSGRKQQDRQALSCRWQHSELRARHDRYSQYAWHRLHALFCHRSFLGSWRGDEPCHSPCQRLS